MKAWLCALCQNVNPFRAERCLRCDKIRSGRDQVLVKMKKAN
jgi:ribosomal protein L40E